MSVYIGIPSYDGKLHWTTCQGLVGLSHLCAKASVGIAIDVIPHDAFIGKARDTIAKRFMDSGMESLMFIDADIGFEPHSVVDLCKAAPDIVMGLYLLKSPKPRYPALMAEPIVRHPSDMRLIKLLQGTTGFLRIRRRVIEKMIAKWPDDYYHHGEVGKIHHLFPSGLYGHQFSGEDIQFCARAIECGFDLWAMQGIKLRHWGEQSWDSNWRIDMPANAPKVAPFEMGATDGPKLERVA